MDVENKENRRSSLCEINSCPTEETKLKEILNNPEYFSPYDDLAFVMYVDTDIAKIIKNMEIKKHLAVISKFKANAGIILIFSILDERFEYARKLKNAMLKLRVAGEKLGKYELEKRHAIEVEDYDRARYKKNQIDQYRNEIYEELHVEQLMETQGVSGSSFFEYTNTILKREG